ncbi:hypothetical protein ACWGR3_31375 [Streptomyces albidoflavus]
MSTTRIPAAVIVVAVAALLAGCAGPSTEDPVIAPVTMSVGELQGKTVDLEVGQVLNITTGDLEGSSYSGDVADTSVAEFVLGREDGDTAFNPGIRALADGETQVVLSNSDGGIEDVTFTVEVGEGN